MLKKLPMAAWILIAMVIGILLGYMVNTNNPTPNRRPRSLATSR